MARTVLEQGHLSPVPLAVQPQYWTLDHSLRLQPLPDAVIVGESQDPYTHTHAGATVMCPGQFAGEGSFLLYRPALGRVELSAVRPNATDD
jgi:DNA polymerase epsilon subunit 2